MTPAWHDVPPVPGNYQVRYSDGHLGVSPVYHPEMYTPGDRKFYGPLPAPPPIPEPPKPPRFFTAKNIASGRERYAIVRDNKARIFDADGRYVTTTNVDVLDLFYTDIRWYAPETA